MSLFIILLIIVIALIFLTAVLKFSPFISFILVSILAGLMFGMPIQGIAQSFQKGIGDMLGSIIIILAAGAMIGKLVAESGAAKVIADKVMSVFGEKYLSWGLMLTGLIIGIPLFYNVGFVMVIPIIFSLVHQYKLPAVKTAIPILASLSIAHCLLPPHPSPASLVGIFHANMAITFLYGIAIAIPAIILAGPVFSKTVKNIKPSANLVFAANTELPKKLPIFSISLFSALLPVFLLIATFAITTLISLPPSATNVLNFIKEPSILMLFCLLFVTLTLGLMQGGTVKKVMSVYEDGIKDIAMIILIIGASGGLKQVLIDSHVSDEIATLFKTIEINPLILGWLIAAIIRLALGSATVAGLTAAGIISPLMSQIHVDPNLMILAIGSGSIFCSHVNDTGFWMFKEYFNISIKETFLSWSLMETIISVMGLLGVLAISLLV